MFWCILIAVLIGLRLLAGYPQSTSRTMLSRVDQAILASLGDIVLPKGGELDLSFTEAGGIAYVDRYLQRQSWLTPILIKLLLRLFEHAPLIFVPSIRRMSSMEHEQRTLYVQSWIDSDLYFRRFCIESIKAMLCMAYLDSPAIMQKMGVTTCAQHQIPAPASAQ